MTGFRGSDETLEREIEALERIGRLRIKRYTRDLDDVARDLATLKKERARRRADSHATVESTSEADATIRA